MLAVLGQPSGTKQTPFRATCLAYESTFQIT